MSILQMVAVFSGCFGAIGVVYLICNAFLTPRSEWDNPTKEAIIALVCVAQMPVVLIVCAIIKGNT